MFVCYRIKKIGGGASFVYYACSVEVSVNKTPFAASFKRGSAPLKVGTKDDAIHFPNKEAAAVFARCMAMCGDRGWKVKEV